MIHTVKDLEKQYPQLVNQIRQDARKESAQSRVVDLAKEFFGNEAGERFGNLVNTGITAAQFQEFKKSYPARPAAGHDAAAEFNRAVGQLVSKKGCSRGEAIKQVARSQPALHQAYIQDKNKKPFAQGQKARGRSGQHADKSAVVNFNRAVNDTMAEKGCDRSEAIRVVAKKNPDLHRAYVESSNS